jgi:hypothetical protein
MNESPFPTLPRSSRLDMGHQNKKNTVVPFRSVLLIHGKAQYGAAHDHGGMHSLHAIANTITVTITITIAITVTIITTTRTLVAMNC